jgi:hypothetical protein
MPLQRFSRHTQIKFGSDNSKLPHQTLESTLWSVGEALQEHTRQWATAQVLLERLEDLASPAVFVVGQAFLSGLQNRQAPEMATLLSHMMANLPSTMDQKFAKLGDPIAEVKRSFGVIIPPY